MADNPYMALTRRADTLGDSPEAASENPYLSLVKPDFSGVLGSSTPTVSAPAPRAAIPNAPLGEDVTTLDPVVVRPPAESLDRTWGEFAGDAATAIRRGARNVTSGLVGAPVNLFNAIVDMPGRNARAAAGYADSLRSTIGMEPLGTEVPSLALSQPDAVSGIQESIAITNQLDADERLSQLAKAQQREFAEAEGLGEVAGFIRRNPSFLATEAAGQVPQVALAAVPGSALGTIAAQSISAGSQNADQIAQELRRQGVSEEEIARVTGDAFTASAGLNAATTLLPGGRALERVIGGGAGRVAGQRAGAALGGAVLGETASETLAEVGDQAIQNLATGAPIDANLAQSGVLGALLGVGSGAAAGTADAAAILGDRSRNTDPSRGPGPFPNQSPPVPDAPQTSAIAPDIIAAGNAALRAPQPAIPTAVPAAQSPAVPDGSRSAGGDLGGIVAPEGADDLDALLTAANQLPPEAAVESLQSLPPQAAAQALQALPPEVIDQALAVLGDSPAPTPAPQAAAPLVGEAVSPPPPAQTIPAPAPPARVAKPALAAEPAPSPRAPQVEPDPIDIPAVEAVAAPEPTPIDDTPAPPQPIQYGKRSTAASADTGNTARAQARVDRMFDSELDPSNPDIETRVENGRTFVESRRTRQAIETALAQPDDQAGHMLRAIASQDGIRPEQKWLAEKLAPTMKALGVKLVEPPANLPYAGAYNNVRNELWIRQAAPTVALHEALHGATSALLTYKTGQEVNPTLGRVRQEFDDMLSHLRQHVEANGIDAAPVEIQDLLENKAGPLANVKELLSYGMTEKPFQQYLAAVPAPPNRSGWRTMWDAFKSAIRAMLGGDRLTSDQRSFLDALIESAGELVDFAADNPGVARLAQTTEAGRIAREQYQRATRAQTTDPTVDAAQMRTTRPEAEARAEVRRDEAAGTLPTSRGTPGWRYDESSWEGRKGAASRARAELQDKMIAWRDVQNQIEEQLGQAIPDVQNVYRLENLMHGRVSEGIDRIERQQVEPLVKAMKDAGVQPAALEEYLYARHAKERNAHIATINPTMPDGGSGMTDAEADAILARADSAKLDPLAARVDAITKATRKRMLEHGLITQEAFDAMESQYSAYVPLRGKATRETDFQGGGAGAGRGVDTRAAPVKQALGRGAGNRAASILGEVIGDAQRSVILAEKARVGRAVMRIVLANPNPALWTVDPVQTERTTDANGEVYERVVNDWSDPSIVAVRHRGQLYKVEIQSQPLAQALNNVGVDQLGTITRAAGAINRYFSAVLTKYNPAFVPVNASRDALFGLTGLAVEHGESAALDAALHYPQAAIAATRHAAGKGGNGQWDTWAREFTEAGGKTGYVSMPSAEDLARKIGSGRLGGYSPEGVARVARAIGDVVGVLNDGVENALRLSAYVTLRKRGTSSEAAAEYAKNLTVNFNRKGLSGSKLNAWFLFYNAAMQGSHRVTRLLKQPKTYAYLGALSAVQVVATLAALGMEDDNGEPLWNKVPDHVKRRNIVIVLPDQTLLTIPMPYGFNVFPYMAGRMTGALLDRETSERKLSDNAAAVTADVIGAAVEGMVPVPIGEGALGLLPTVLRIPSNVQTNRDDFGRPIRREDPYAKSAVPRASMGRPDTLEVFKLTSRGLNRLGGGDDLTPPPLPWFDVAPEDVEYLLKELTGGTGKFVVDVATVGQKVTGGDYAEDASPRDVPILNRFRSNIDEQAAQQAMFYQRRDVVERSLKRVRATFAAEGEAPAQAMLEASPELTGAAFKRRKGNGRNGEPPGSVILVDGSPQIIASDENLNRGTRGRVWNPQDLSVFAAYKAASKAMEERSDAVEAAYAASPASILPTEKTRHRDAYIRTSDSIRQGAQSKFNEAWVRDVVGVAE